MNNTQSQDIILLEDMQLLLETRDFFEVKPSKAITVFLFSVIALLVAFVLWVCFAQMDDVVKGSAVLRPVQSVSSIYTLSSGKITYINYKENQLVHKGDILLSLENEANKKKLDNIMEQLSSAQNDKNNADSFYQSLVENKQVAEKGSQAALKYEFYIAQFKKYESQIQQLESELSRKQSMPESFRVPVEIADARAELFQSRLSFAAWKSEQIINAMQACTDAASALQNLQNQKTNLEQTIQDSIIYAPIDGYINQIMPLNINDYLLSGTEIMHIVPSQNNELKAHIVVDAANIARIKMGQKAKLRFTGLPPSQFGQLDCCVSLIPADMTLYDGNAVFEIEADVNDPFLKSVSGEKFFLHSGINAQARIVISHDSVLKMILQKLDFISA